MSELANTIYFQILSNNCNNLSRHFDDNCMATFPFTKLTSELLDKNVATRHSYDVPSTFEPTLRFCRQI